MPEIFWDRLGFILIGIISGLIYALTFALILYPFMQSIDLLLVFKVFVAVFGLAGLLFGEAIFKSLLGCIYALYLIYGFLIGILLPATAQASDESMFPNKSSGKFFVSVGIFAGALCLFLLNL